MTKDEFKRIITRIEATWRTTITDLEKEIYGENLGELDYHQVTLAIKSLAHTSKYCPVSADIRQEYHRLTAGRIDVGNAVNLVYDTVRAYGRYGYAGAMENILSQDEIAHHVVKCIGYINLCNGNPDFTRPEFEKIYKGAAEDFHREKSMSPRLMRQIESFKTKIIEQNNAILEMVD